MNEECPSCKRVTNTSCSRLVKDSCGHTKCRMCLLYEDEGCKICNKNCILNAKNYDFQSSVKEHTDNVTGSSINSKCNREVVLPLELVIHKHSKLKDHNFELILNDCTSNSEIYYENTCNKNKEICKSSPTDTKNNDIVNKSYVSKVETNNVHLNVRTHLTSNVPTELLSYSKTTENSTSENKTELSIKGKLVRNKSIKCYDRSHISVIPGTPEKYKCNICNKIFRNKKGKCYHDTCVTGIRPYECIFCDRTFIKRSHFEYHERIHRGYKPFKCHLCEKAFPQQNKLNRHMYSHTKEKRFVCPTCNKGYIKRDDLKNHLNVHNDKTYTCKACEKTFRVLTNLKRHLKTHTSERPHVCDQCTKSFKDKSLLIRHKKTHGKDRPFSCAHCSRVFLSKSELRRHLTVHSDEKPFSCKYCQTVFRRKDNLHRHVRHHHPENPPSNTVDKVQSNESNINTNLEKTKQINSKQKLKTKKVQKITYNSLPKSSAKVSVVCVNSRDQISSRLDSMGNITPVIRTTSEVSNAVPVINGPISIKKSENKTDTRKKMFTYTEPIPVAEAVVINKRIEEKLYPQNAASHNYFFRNCLNCIDKSYPISVNQTFSTTLDIKNSAHKTASYENSFSESNSSTKINLKCYSEDKLICNEKEIKLKPENENKNLVINSNEI
ncbi:uncharacterized protein LOC143181604 [Calliopsis andreniformis]|uniref:uncharacterized protein LOC143181604 n=1 Tax=Calliopsis andreniformis TaxID=337506 RepID=UPI003FCDD491